MKTYYARSSKGYYSFVALNLYEARTWIINHLDTSYEWTLGEIINPTIKPTK